MQLTLRTTQQKHRRSLILLALAAAGLIPAAGALGLAVLSELLSAGGCLSPAAGSAALVPGGRGTVVGASEYGPPGVDLTVQGNDGAYALLRPGGHRPPAEWRPAVRGARALVAAASDRRH